MRNAFYWRDALLKEKPEETDRRRSVLEAEALRGKVVKLRAKGLTQREVASLLNVTRQYVQKIEKPNGGSDAKKVRAA